MMKANVSSPDLFARKIELLEKPFFQSRSQFSHSDEFTYHGIPLRFYCEEKSFLLSLKKFLPRSWHGVKEEPFEIFLIDPQKYEISQDEFSDESSQDLYTPHMSMGVQRDFAARVIDEKKSLLICHPSIDDGLFNFLRWFLPLKLLEEKKLILHSSCVLDERGLAHIFLGHSGAGKSTVASLRGEREVLGDDMNIVCFKNGTPFVSAGAIGGAFASTVGYEQQFPIHGFYWLVQDRETKKISLSRVDAHNRLLSSFANLPWEAMQKPHFNFLFSCAHKLTETAPVYELHFRKTQEFWYYVK